MTPKQRAIELANQVMQRAELKANELDRHNEPYFWDHLLFRVKKMAEGMPVRHKPEPLKYLEDTFDNATIARQAK